MLTPAEWGPAHVAQRLGDALARLGYTVTPLESGHGVFATARGHSAGIFLPWTDFIFIVDIDAERLTDTAALDVYHEGVRAFGEGHMRVPRALRYRVPNSVTFGVTAGPLSEEMIAYARASRHKVNSGEKNAVYLLDLSSGTLHSQGLEYDHLSRYSSATWAPNVNPANRCMRTLVLACGEVMGVTQVAADSEG